MFAALLSLSLAAGHAPAHVYLIDGEEVSQAKFEKLEATLQLEGHPVCKEKNHGGSTRQWAHDAEGHRYQVREDSERGEPLRSSITRVRDPEPTPTGPANGR